MVIMVIVIGYNVRGRLIKSFFIKEFNEVLIFFSGDRKNRINVISIVCKR